MFQMYNTIIYFRSKPQTFDHLLCIGSNIIERVDGRAAEDVRNNQVDDYFSTNGAVSLGNGIMRKM